MIRIALAAALPFAMLAIPALATERAHSPQQVSAALKAGCTVQQVHSPAGKPTGHSAIVHCPKAATIETASRDTARGQPRTARD